MGWFSNATEWAKKIWYHDTTAAAANYSYQTIAYCLEQIAAAPKVMRSVITHPPTRVVARHLLRMATEDLIPLVFVTYFNQCLQERGQTYLDENPDAAWLSTNTAIQYSLYLIQLTSWAIRVNRKTELITRMAIVTLEASPMLGKVNTSSTMTVCVEGNDPCTKLRFMQGSIRDLTAYWSTEAAIALIGYTPIAGGTLAALLSVYHNGRYVLTVALPDLCNRHQVVYLREHSELALSLGVGHAASSLVVNSLMEVATGIPRVFYAGAIEQFILMTQMSVAAHLRLPIAQKSSSRNLPDPVLYFQNGVGFIVDTLLLGLKAKIPRMLKGREPGSNVKSLLINLSNTEYFWLTRLVKISQKMGASPLAHIVPRLLRTKQSFLQDPIISSNWAAVKISLVDTLKTIESLHNELLVQAASYTPDTAANLVESIFGTPKFITKLLLQLVSDKEVIEQLRTWRYQIEKLHADSSTTSMIVDQNALLLPGQIRPSDAHPQPQVLLEETSLPAPEQVIREPIKASSSLELPSVEAVIRRKCGAPLAGTELSDTVAPERVIRYRFLAQKPRSNRVDHSPDGWTVISHSSENWSDINGEELSIS